MKLNPKRVDEVWNKFPITYQKRLEEAYTTHTTEEEREEISFNAFLRRMIHEVVYYAEFGHDGNWDDMEAIWGVTDGDYRMFKQVMLECGWTSDVKEW